KYGSLNAMVEKDDFDRKELEYLSLRLNPLECFRLINIMSASMKYIPEIRTTRILREYFNNDGITKRDCLIRLENWNNNYLGANTLKKSSLEKIHKIVNNSGEENSNRATMDVTLRMLGRPDLAKYVTRNRNVKSFDAIVNDDISKGKSHPISKRNLHKNSEEGNAGKEKEKNEKVKENCTNQVHENQHTASSTEGKKTSQEKPNSNDVSEEKQVTDTTESSPSMPWLNLFLLLIFFFVVSCIILFCITRKWKRTKLMGAKPINHLEEKGKVSGCTCNCSELDIESGSLDQGSPKYHRTRRTDQEKSRVLLKKRKKEKPRDLCVKKYPDTCVKKNSKVKEKRKKHKSKRKSLRTKDIDDGKLDRKRIRLNAAHDFKSYPVCDCCK
ncbi:DNA ligase 1-like, partial [Vespula squamosa]